MMEQMRQELQTRFKGHCKQVLEVWALQHEAGNPASFLNGVRQMTEGIVGDLFEALLAEKPDAVKSPKDTRKGPLDGRINALRDNGWIDARVHSHFNILRVCGNFGSHQQDTPIDPELVKSAAGSLRACMVWYAGQCLETPFDVDDFLGKAPMYVRIKPEEPGKGGKGKTTLRRVAGRARGSLASLVSLLVQLAIILAGTAPLYILFNRYGDELLGLFGMKTP